MRLIASEHSQVVPVSFRSLQTNRKRFLQPLITIARLFARAHAAHGSSLYFSAPLC